MKFVKIDTQNIKDRTSFHLEFKKAMGFPEFYGMNMNAWIDCMSDIEGRMTKSELNSNEPVCLVILNAEDF